jgi:NAD-dependent dihydropyrimidine dehydrogenase PreA subunit
MAAKKVLLRFSNHLISQPIVYRLVKDYGLTFNILKAQILPDEEGEMVLEIGGDSKKYKQGIAFLKETGVEVLDVDKEITKDLDRCYQCSACTAVCPSGAISIDRQSMWVSYDSEKCIVCELCVGTCPARAMQVFIK